MNLEPDKVLNLDIETAYRAYIQVLLELGQEKSKDTIYTDVRNGIKLKFDIYDFFLGNYREDSKNKEVKIPKKHGNYYNLYEFYTEIEDREGKLKKALLDYLESEEEIRTPRK